MLSSSTLSGRQLHGCRIDAVVLDGTLQLTFRTSPDAWAGLDTQVRLEIGGDALELQDLAVSANAGRASGTPVSLTLPSRSVVRVLPVEVTGCR